MSCCCMSQCSGIVVTICTSLTSRKHAFHHFLMSRNGVQLLTGDVASHLLESCTILSKNEQTLNSFSLAAPQAESLLQSRLQRDLLPGRNQGPRLARQWERECNCNPESSEIRGLEFQFVVPQLSPGGWRWYGFGHLLGVPPERCWSCGGKGCLCSFYFMAQDSWVAPCVLGKMNKGTECVIGVLRRNECVVYCISFTPPPFRVIEYDPWKKFMS